MTHPIEIHRNETNQIIRLAVFEYFNPNKLYAEVIAKFADDKLDFSFLTIKNYLGNIVLGQSQKLVFQKNSLPHMHIIYNGVFDRVTASKSEQLFFEDVFHSIYLDKFKHKQTTAINQKIDEIYLLEAEPSEALHVKPKKTFNKEELTPRINIVSEHSRIELDFKLKDRYVLSESDKHAGKPSVDIINSFLNEGSAAQAYTIWGKFRGGFVQKEKNVALDFVVNDENQGRYNADNRRISSTANVLNSVLFCEKIGYLSPRKPKHYVHNGEHHLLVKEKKIPGIDLVDFFIKYDLHSHNGPKGNNEFTIDEYLDLVHETSLSVLRFLHFRNIIHRDLKPDNIKVQLITNLTEIIQFNVYPFDTELSKFATQSDAEQSQVGTPDYCSPEAFRGMNTTTKSDAYSMMLFLLYPLENSMPPVDQAVDPSKFMRVYRTLWQLVENKQLKQIYANKIINLFEASLKFDPAKRYDVITIINETAIIDYEIRIDRLSNKLTDKIKLEYEKANTLANEVKSKQYDYQTKIVNDITIYYPTWLSSVTTKDIKEFEAYILERVNQLTDDPIIMEEFSRSSCIKAIRGLAKKELIKAEISSITHNYLKITEKLANQQAEALDKTGYSKLIDLQNQYILNIDDLKELTSIYEHELKKVNKKDMAPRPPWD